MTRKTRLIRAIVARLEEEAQTLARSARAAHEAATHEESKAEDAHDTRGLEASYLAGAQLARLESLKRAITHYQFLDAPPWTADRPLGVGALVELAGDDGRRLSCFLVTQAGGGAVPFEGGQVQLVTPQSPLGEALIGRRAGETAEVEGQRGAVREYEILQAE